MASKQETQTIFIIMAPTGRMMASTTSLSPYAAKKKVLDKAEQKYHGLVESNFQKWEEKGYTCIRALITAGKRVEY